MQPHREQGIQKGQALPVVSNQIQNAGRRAAEAQRGLLRHEAASRGRQMGRRPGHTLARRWRNKDAAGDVPALQFISSPSLSFRPAQIRQSIRFAARQTRRC
ncbi:hypothetical protein AURDEDRAFT_116711 [Auricularia subglabra TFB-10046 SS5]|uniref:Uncharacterized protein n=1 Tax=Auricularia subglabra (strain TFB-10046 / SS5) TaxID=717982 RepID=J0LHK0_AURST|nr:hypothetical protein AURDEDRAFT_116711 [Auricularia subglabra TFB-10046 SS5]